MMRHARRHCQSALKRRAAHRSAAPVWPGFGRPEVRLYSPRHAGCGTFTEHFIYCLLLVTITHAQTARGACLGSFPAFGAGRPGKICACLLVVDYIV